MLKVRIGPLEVELESLDQVVELARRIGGGSPQQLALPVPVAPVVAVPPPPRPAARPSLVKAGARSAWDYDAAWNFLTSSLEGTARKFMGHIVSVKKINSAAMADAIGVPVNTLGPAIRSIRAKASAIGKPMPFVVKPQPGSAGKLYVVAQDFDYAASNNPAIAAVAR